MLRKVILGSMLGVGSLWLIAQGEPVGAGEKSEAKATPRPHYVHTVIFYLKKDAPEGESEALIQDAHELLTKIPSVRFLSIGRPAKQSTPKFSVKDYQVGLLVLFDSFDGLKTYLDHPLHLKYVERHAKYLEKIPVYDFINQKK
jgi:hypothetical protein